MHLFRAIFIIYYEVNLRFELIRPTEGRLPTYGTRVPGTSIVDYLRKSSEDLPVLYLVCTSYEFKDMEY